MEYFDIEAFEKVHCNGQLRALQGSSIVSIDQLVDVCKRMNIQDSAMLTLKKLAGCITSPDRREAIVRANPHFASIFGHRLIPASETTPNQTINPILLSQKFDPSIEALGKIFEQELILKDAPHEDALLELLKTILNGPGSLSKNI